jgi:GTP-binding nuclear protein Ran
MSQKKKLIFYMFPVIIISTDMSSDIGVARRDFKVLVVGDGGVGKTSYMQIHEGERFERKYLPTVGVDVRSLDFHTNEGVIGIHCWDVAGQEKFGYLRQGYYRDADAAIIMFDVSCMVTYKSVKRWYDEIVAVCGEIPIVLVANKCDVTKREVSPESVTIHRKMDLPYYEISVKSNYNWQKPMLWIMGVLIGNPDIYLTHEHNATP